MKTRDEGHDKYARLRWRAEEIVRGKGSSSMEDLETLSADETRQTIHELRVHQIELKMQNEELLRAQTELDAARARYFDLYDLAPVGYCIVSQEGLIMEANLTAVTLLGVARAALVKQPITRFILQDDQDIYYLHRKEFLRTGKPHACELRMKKNDGSTLWVRLAATIAQEPMTGSGAEGAPVIRVVLSDISDRKQVEEEKSQLEAKLQQARKHRLIGAKTGRSEGGSRVPKK